MQTTDVVIIGGGVAGLSTAMQLALRARVIVVERERIGNGSTGRAAGLLGQLRGTAEHTRLLVDGVKIVRWLQEQTGKEIFVETGSLRVASSQERAQEIKDLVEMGHSIGFPIESMSIDDVARRMPYMRCDDLTAACYCPTDGHLEPAELVASYIQLGRGRGVEYRSQSPVRRILVRDGAAYGILLDDVEIHAAAVVNAGGPWSYCVAETAGEVLPTAAIGHDYLCTRPDPRQPIDRMSPAVRDRQHRIYSRPDRGGLIVGIYSAEPEPYDPETFPDHFDMSAMKAAKDSYHVALLIHAAQQRFPWINERTPMSITTGIMTFTPDGKPFCGRMPGVDRLFHCAGFSGHGIVQSPVIGVIMADLILNGSTDYDLKEIEADRFYDLPGYRTRDEIKSKCRTMAGSYYGRIEGQSAESLSQGGREAK